MNQLASTFTSMPAKTKLALGGGLVVGLIAFVLLARLATAPSYETLLSGIDPAETGKVTEALDEQGIAYQLQNGGTALAVQPEQQARARIALAQQGLPGEGQPGFELFDEQRLGTSDFQQQVNYQRALEGEIARTLEQVDGVSGAQVQLVLPDDQLFEEDRRPSTASVLLSGDTSGLAPGAVRGMAQLVSSSVEGLALDKVTITDGTGRLLWPREGADGATAEGGTSRQAAEQRHDQALEGQLTALLARTVGADKAQVQVQSRLNMDRVRERELRYDRRGVPLRTQTEEEELESEGGGVAGGAAGAAGNLPGYAQGAGAGGGESNYERRQENTEMGVGRTVTEREVAAGAVERLNVAVVLDASVPAATANQLRSAVASAAGIDVARGDELTMSRVAFARPPAPAERPVVEGLTGYLKWAGLALASLLFLFFMRRGLRKREREALAEPVWLKEITAPQSLAALEAPAGEVSPRHGVKQRAEQLAAREPDKVAAQLRNWMQEGA
jgi:flagellar M-ring protein FliF